MVSYTSASWHSPSIRIASWRTISCSWTWSSSGPCCMTKCMASSLWGRGSCSYRQPWRSVRRRSPCIGKCRTNSSRSLSKRCKCSGRTWVRRSHRACLGFFWKCILKMNQTLKHSRLFLGGFLYSLLNASLQGPVARTIVQSWQNEGEIRDRHHFHGRTRRRGRQFAGVLHYQGSKKFFLHPYGFPPVNFLSLLCWEEPSCFKFLHFQLR